MSANDEDGDLASGPEFTEEVEIGDLSPDKISNIFSWKEESETAAETDPQKPNFYFEEDDEEVEESKEGSASTFSATMEKLNPIKKIIERRKARSQELDLGIDLSRPKAGAEELDPPSAFQELLKPLSDSELVLLQKDVQADETIYARINKARANANTRQRWAIFITSILAAVYLWILGPGYLTEVLPAAGSDWLPNALEQEMRKKVVFALGLILPFLALLVTSEGVRLTLVGLLDRVPMALFRGMTTLLFSGSALIALVFGQVFLAGIMLIFWLIFKKIIEHPFIRKIQSRRKRD